MDGVETMRTNDGWLFGSSADGDGVLMGIWNVSWLFNGEGASERLRIAVARHLIHLSICFLFLYTRFLCLQIIWWIFQGLFYFILLYRDFLNENGDDNSLIV